MSTSILALWGFFFCNFGLPGFLADLELWGFDFLDLLGFEERKQNGLLDLCLKYHVKCLLLKTLP